MQDTNLDVNLSVDSDFKEQYSCSPNSEIGPYSYNLIAGTHKFKIDWYDTETKQSKQLIKEKNISTNDWIKFYIYRVPKYKLTVYVKNEAEKETQVFLYVDGNFRDKIEVGNVIPGKKDPFIVELEQGDHEVSIKWIDPITNQEYKKTKRVYLDGDESLSFVATKGMRSVEPQDNETAKNLSEIQNEPEPIQVIQKGEAIQVIQKEDANDPLSITALQFKDPSLQEDILQEEGMREAQGDDSSVLLIYLLMLLITIYFAFRR
ncbi:MAG: hypothetical protein JW999_10415 [Methanotrichaceae archaeon]|nr:hypothetical protein [Methanotrichaceae archaeon]